ncbi:hypothetical protein GCM10010836_50680 [Aminobacter aminovorans]
MFLTPAAAGVFVWLYASAPLPKGGGDFFCFDGNSITTLSVGLQRITVMSEGPADATKIEYLIIRRLMKEGNVTEEQARQLIAYLGHDWSSLIREARFVAKKR